MKPEACDAFYLTNLEREKLGLPGLEFGPRCFDMAQDQSADMANRRYFDHNRPDTGGKPGETFAQRAARFGMAKGIGENIAMTGSPASALQMWMNSPGHRRNILSPKYRYLGVGYANGLYTQAFSE